MSTLITEAQLGNLIDAHHQRRGDVLWRMERHPWYDVPSQNADRDAWRHGRADTTAVEAWARVLRDDRRRGLLSQRARVLSADLTDDELMSCQVALPILAKAQDVRVLHRGEHPVPDLLDHDYFVIRSEPASTLVVAMRYADGGAFEGAELVDPADHGPYLEEQRLAWAIGEPFATWWGRHGELHHRTAA